MQHLGVSTTVESLPYELQDLVIDYLREDFKSFCACSLVCSRWLYRSRKLANFQAVVAFTPLFDKFWDGGTSGLPYSIYTPPADKKAPVVNLDPKTKGLIELLNAPHSTLKMAIRRLKFRGACEYYCALEYDVLCEAIPAILPQLSGIKTLTLHNIIWTRLSEAVKDQIAATTASITNLSLDRSTFANITEITSSFSIHRFPSVDTLSMIGLYWENSTLNLDDFDYRREGIRTLKIDGWSIENSPVCIFGQNIHTLSLIVDVGMDYFTDLIEVTKTTLTILNIRIDMIPLVPLYGLVNDETTDDRLSLAECTNLRSLRILLDEFCPDEEQYIAEMIDSASSLGYLGTIYLAVGRMSHYTPNLRLLEPALLKQSSKPYIMVLTVYDESKGTIPQVQTQVQKAREWWPRLSRTGRLWAWTLSERSPVLPFVKVFVTDKLHPSGTGSIKHRAQRVEKSFLNDLLPHTQL
ncbi:hypothetical protein H0H92_010848 [Tricholoma furcatifolium]|nr:hypothetical protein H0H92_010848 [Tricholoma furcatifolium]